MINSFYYHSMQMELFIKSMITSLSDSTFSLSTNTHTHTDTQFNEFDHEKHYLSQCLVSVISFEENPLSIYICLRR